MGDYCSTCFPCLGLDTEEPDRYPQRTQEYQQQAQQDLDARRQRQAEAATRRLQEEEGRGLVDPEATKSRQKRREEIERRAAASGGSEGPLKWTMDK